MIPVRDWNKVLIVTKELQKFLDYKVAEGEIINPLHVFCLLLFSYSVEDINSAECRVEYKENDCPIDSPWFHASYLITCYEEYVELSSQGRISVISSNYLNPRKAFKFLELCNFELPN